MPIERDGVFSRISVDHLTQGGTRVSWEILPNFNLRYPHTFQLQVSTASVSTADDWVDVGTPVSNAFFAIDDDQRNFGASQHTHYRLVLTTPNGTWISRPAHTFGLLRKRDWLLARAEIRRERLGQQHFTAAHGYLLRRKWVGTQPTETQFEIDPLTEEPIKAIHTSTLGTEFVGGYYAPVPFDMELGQDNRNLDQDDQARGTINDSIVVARAVAFPQLNSRDVWVHGSSDVRYSVIKVKHAKELRGVPLIVSVELSPLSRKDAVYSVAVP